MTHFLALLNGSIMLVLAILHFYWAAGGRRGLALALPSDAGGNQVIRPGIAACIAVGTGLLGFSLYYFSKAIAGEHSVRTGISSLVIWVLALIFAARAIGDFRYVGFFKSVKNSGFARMDTRWYSPLCLYLALSSAWIGMYR